MAVGYMDPGNWATGIAGGSAYNYRLLFIIVLSSVSLLPLVANALSHMRDNAIRCSIEQIFAVFLQALSLRLGIVSGMDLAKVLSSPPPLVAE